MYRSHLRKIGETFGDRDPHSITTADVAEWVAVQAQERKPGTVAQYLDCFKLLMDFTGVEPNPARDPRVKLPKRVTEEANPPSDDHFLAIIEKLLPRWRLFFLTVEQGGLRIGEAAALSWGDVDVAGGRLRLPRSATKTNNPGGCNSPRGSWRRSRTPARSRIASLSARCSRDSTSRPHGRR